MEIDKCEGPFSRAKSLPNELIALLVDFIPDDFTYSLSTKLGNGKLYCISPSNNFEYFLKNHFIKRFVHHKNHWNASDQQFLKKYHYDALPSHIERPIVIIDKQNPLIIKTSKLMQFRASRPFSIITGHMYFEAKLLKFAGGNGFQIGVLYSPLFKNYGYYMDTNDRVINRKYELFRSRHCPNMKAGDIYGCGLSHFSSEKSTKEQELFFTINGQQVESIKLPPLVDCAQLFPSIMCWDNCVFEGNFDGINFAYNEK